MKISEGIKHKGRGIGIPDANRRDLARFFSERGYKVGAEIGVGKGSFTRYLARDGLKIYAIDPWLQYEDYQPTRIHYQKRQNAIYESAKKRLARFPNCTIVRKTSMDAVKDFAHGSLDFVYIDGNHGFKYVTEDIFEWSKRVRKGGIVSGHDYAYINSKTHILHVRYVVDAYTRAFDIQNWWVIGRYEVRPEEKRDQYRSFMWIKQ